MPDRVSHYAVNLRLIITIGLAILPIIKAYIIVTNTTLLPTHRPMEHLTVTNAQFTSTTPIPPFSNFLTANKGIFTKIQQGLNDTSSIAKIFFSTQKNVTKAMSPVLTLSSERRLKFDDKATSAKPIDYLVAGVEGIAWVVHFCFIMTIRRSRSQNLRGPVVIRALIFMLIGVSILLLRTHVKHNAYDDVMTNLSLGFSIGSVTLLSLYALTLIPDYRSDQSLPYREVSFENIIGHQGIQ